MVKPNGADGVLMFLGDAADTSNPYMNLEILANKVVLSTNGGKSVTNPKELVLATAEEKEKDKSDKWYQVEVERKFGSVVVKVSDAKLGVVSNTVPVELQLDSPIASFSVSSEILVAGTGSQKKFTGCMDSFVVDGRQVGLWNYKSASKLSGCILQRDPVKGSFQLDGDGFAQLAMDELASGLRKIQFTFNTLDPNALLFLGTHKEKSENYFAIELVDGKLTVKYTFRGELKTVTLSEKNYNDGQSYSFVRKKKKWEISKVPAEPSNARKRRQTAEDETTKEEGKIEEIGTDYAVTDVFLGGVPMRQMLPNANITTDGFVGCLSGVGLRGLSSPTAKAYHHYSPSCAPVYGRSASFLDTESYMEVKACSVEENKALGFSFQTYAKDGVLLYATADGPKDNKLGVSAKDGKLMVDLTVEGGSEQVSFDTEVSDGEWHTFVIGVANGKMSAYLDEGTKDFAASASSLELSGNMFVGGKAGESSSFNGNLAELLCGNEERHLNVPVKNKVAVGSLTFQAPVALVAPPAPTTAAPTMPPGTTSAPVVVTTEKATDLPTDAPTTQAQTDAPVVTTVKAVDTTEKPTEAPTTNEPTTEKPTTTESPTTTEKPTTMAVTDAPTDPPTDPPTTKAPTDPPTDPPTEAPTTQAACVNTAPLKDGGFEFGMSSPSYVAYQADAKKIEQKSSYEFWFNTYELNALLMASSGGDFDYEHVYLQDGKVVYTFNAGTGALRLVSSKTFNDGQWHKVETTREKTAGFLKVDDAQVGTGDEKSKPGASYVNKISTVYFGGIPEDSNMGNTNEP